MVRSVLKTVTQTANSIDVSTVVSNVTSTRNTMLTQDTQNNQVKKFLSLQGAACHVTISSDMILTTVVDNFTDSILSVVDPNGPRASALTSGAVGSMPAWTNWNVDWVVVALVLGDPVSFLPKIKKGWRPRIFVLMVM